MSHSKLKDACNVPGGVLSLDFPDVLKLLQAAGLVRMTGSLAQDPIAVRPILSLLSLPQVSSSAAGLRPRLALDLKRLLEGLHASSSDFFRPGPKGKELVPEAVFTAFLALGFELLGWQAEREAQYGAGRTDIKLRLEGSDELAVIEVKIWGRTGHREVHRQVESYWSRQVVAGAVVMLSDTSPKNWHEAYRRTCLTPFNVKTQLELLPDSPIRARFACSSTTSDGTSTHIDHFLLQVRRGR